MSFWEGKRVLITGSSGFLGRHLVAAMPSESSYIGPTRAVVDLLDHAKTVDYFTRTQPHVVIHLAATVGGIGANSAAPYQFFIDNIRMGSNVLDACRAARVRHLVMVGTTCSYPAETPVPFRESDLWSGYPEATNAPYGIAKRALIAGTQALEKQYGVRVVNVIPTNLYGPGDNFNPDTSHVIPALISKVDDGGTLVLWGTGQATRDFLYVEDAARGILHMAEHATDSEPINLGSGLEVSIKNLVNMIAEVAACPLPDIIYDHSKPDGQRRRLLDISRAKVLGWEPTTSLRDGLRKTWEAYCARPAK